MRVERDWRGGRERRFLSLKARAGLRLRVRVAFVPNDAWLGVFWRRSEHYTNCAEVFVCLLPMCPVIFELSWYGRWARKHPLTRATA